MAAEKYLELYKRHRPNKWGQLVGQLDVAKTLKSAVVHDKLPTAYGFFGERGCGKTSAALILAKAINCLNPEDGNPCNKCDICISIDRGNQIGVNYISMANKGSVDDVREIVRDARLSSTINRQVFILDEVHTLSKQAFDALLIPLEDNKMPALFILCSTEIQKIPQTVISRIQSRNFNLVDSATMTKYLEHLVKKDGLDIDKAGIDAAVRIGRGSVRDSLSALESVADLGAPSQSYGSELLVALGKQNLSEVLQVVAKSDSEKIKPRDFTEQLFEDLRDLFVIASGGTVEITPALSDEEEKAVIKGMLGYRGLNIALDEIGDALTRMSLGADGRVHLEIALVKTLQKMKQLRAKMVAAKQ